MSVETLPPLRHRIPTLPELPADRRHLHARVYVHGLTPAHIVGDVQTYGARVLVTGEPVPMFVEWDRLTVDPAPPLRFTIARDDMQAGREWSPWAVFGNRPDADSEYQWAHFPTHAEAVAYAAAELSKEHAR